MAVMAEWIAVDWGTSRLRAWAMKGDEILAEASSDAGMSKLTKTEFEPALLGLIEDWLGHGQTEVVACGMVGARQGWVEAPYAAVPVAPLSAPPIRVPDTDPRLAAYVVPGLKQTRQPDVMRGEETQVAGFLSAHDDWDGVICLPGTHTKWIHISAGEVVSFRTFMTGEIFDLLSGASVLRHSVGEGWDDTSFQSGLDATLSRPESISAELFGLRANDLLNGADPNACRARLSGLLIGAELAAARAYWLGQSIAVVGAEKLSATYAQALKKQGAFVTLVNGQDMTIAGLIAARKAKGT